MRENCSLSLGRTDPENTLIGCIIGEINYDEGNVILGRFVRISYLPQQGGGDSEYTAFERILSFNAELSLMRYIT